MIYLKGWSEGEPIKSVDKGTYDILELGIFVSIQSEGNIVFEELLPDESQRRAGWRHTPLDQPNAGRVPGLFRGP